MFGIKSLLGTQVCGPQVCVPSENASFIVLNFDHGSGVKTVVLFSAR